MLLMYLTNTHQRKFFHAKREYKLFTIENTTSPAHSLADCDVFVY